jgi:hypothetical protein
MPNTVDKPSSPAWKGFAPLQPDARKIAPQSSGPVDRQRGCCRFCKYRRFLRSGLRVSDIGSMFLLHYPVRCLRCRQRQFTDFMTASLSLSSGSQVYSNHKKRENWGAWTSGSDREAIEALREKLKSDTLPGRV